MLNGCLAGTNCNCMGAYKDSLESLTQISTVLTGANFTNRVPYAAIAAGVAYTCLCDPRGVMDINQLRMMDVHTRVDWPLDDRTYQEYRSDPSRKFRTLVGM